MSAFSFDVLQLFYSCFTAKTRDFTPRLELEGDTLEVVDKLKLLGVQVTSDLKWTANTAYVTKKGFCKLWTLRRLQEQIKKIYVLYTASMGEAYLNMLLLFGTLHLPLKIQRIYKDFRYLLSQSFWGKIILRLF